MSEPDLIVVGSSPCGIACAVRAARAGLSVTLVSEGRHVGGMLSSGIGVMDTQYDGRRAPLYDEICDRIKDYYRERYGVESPQYRTCLPGDRTSSSNRLTFEPHVAEAVLEQLVAEHAAIELLRGWLVDGVERDVDRVVAVLLRREDGAQRQRLAAALFVDATYTADLATQAGWRTGWDARIAMSSASRTPEESSRSGSTRAGSRPIRAWGGVPVVVAALDRSGASGIPAAEPLPLRIVSRWTNGSGDGLQGARHGLGKLQNPPSRRARS